MSKTYSQRELGELLWTPAKPLTSFLWRQRIYTKLPRGSTTRKFSQWFVDAGYGVNEIKPSGIIHRRFTESGVNYIRGLY